MMKFSSISKVAAAVILGSLVFSGCGGGGGSSSSTPADAPATVAVAGTGLAAYRSDATTFIDCNKDGIKDATESNTTTDVNGSYSTTTICTDYNIVMFGGRNSETNLSIPYPTTAPKGYTKVSPITTMLTDLNTTARAELLSDLGLDTAALNLDYNVPNTTSSAAQEIISKVAAIKSFIETAIISVRTQADMAKVATSFVTAVPANMNFSSPGEVATLATTFSASVKAAIPAIDMNTSLHAQVTNIVAVAQTTNATAFTENLNTIEEANAETIAADLNISQVKVGSVTIGGETITLDNNNTFDHNITSSHSIADFFSVAFSDVNVTENFTEQNVTLSVEIKDDANNSVSLSIAGVKLTGTKGTATNNIHTVIPAGSKVTATQTGLANLQSIMGASVDANTTAESVNSDLSVNVQSLNLQSNKIDEVFTALNQYINTVNTYTLTFSIQGLDATKVYAPSSIVGTISVQ